MSNSNTSKASQIATSAEERSHEAHQLLTGQVPHTDIATGHPLHPGTVHWPIAFLSTSFGINALELLPANLYPAAYLPAQAALSRFAYWTAGAGVITAIPAITTGIGEAYELIRSEYKRKGSWSKVVDYAWNMKDDEGRKIKMTMKHASMNDMVVALAAWNWYLGYKNKPIPTVNKALGAVALPALLYSAMLGGKMVYEFAMGVQRQGQGKDIREQAQTSLPQPETKGSPSK